MKNLKALARSEIVRRAANGIKEVVKNAPDNARKAVKAWRKKREESR